MSHAADRALMAELATRLADLARDLDAKYDAAASRLYAARQPGAHEVDEGVADLVEVVRWLRRDLDGLTFANGDLTRWTWWYIRDIAEAEGVPFTDAGVARLLVDEVGRRGQAAAYRRYRRGKERVAG